MSMADSIAPAWPWSDAATYDGGQTGCGELLLELMLFAKTQPAGARMALRALDPGAPSEIPAWCRLTGHQLITAIPPYYLIHKP